MPLGSKPQPKYIAILQLMRLPNVLTAVADIAMGYLITHGDLQPAAMFALLAIASVALYLSGMVLNDVFDVEVDTRERPTRPIPSGRVPLKLAQTLGWSLLVTGIALSWIVGITNDTPRPGIVATLLATCVVLYDWTLKRTPLAPIFMGACRTLNVLLGMSLAAEAWQPFHWLIAIGVGTYIVGVTIFARTEAIASKRAMLAFGSAVALAGFAILVQLPSKWVDPVITKQTWHLFWGLLFLLIFWRFAPAIREPSPKRVQPAVRNAVQSIIVIDAALVAGLVGTNWGMVVVLFLVPTFALTQWLRST